MLSTTGAADRDPERRPFDDEILTFLERIPPQLHLTELLVHSRRVAPLPTCEVLTRQGFRLGEMLAVARDDGTARAGPLAPCAPKGRPGGDRPPEPSIEPERPLDDQLGQVVRHIRTAERHRRSGDECPLAPERVPGAPTSLGQLAESDLHGPEGTSTATDRPAIYESRAAQAWRVDYFTFHVTQAEAHRQ